MPKTLSTWKVETTVIVVVKAKTAEDAIALVDSRLKHSKEVVDWSRPTTIGELA